MIKQALLLVALVSVVCSTTVPHGKYVRTPLGHVWSTCLHKVAKGAHIIEDEDGKTTVVHPDGTSRVLPRCPMPSKPRTASTQPTLNRNNAKRDEPDDGWQLWTAFNNENNNTFDSFLGYFNVPPEPLNWDGGILYLFTGLQNDNWVPIGNPWPPTPPGFDIIQPVLQYGGDSENGGGDYWGLASWYVTLDSGALWSDLEVLNPGDVIFGNMTKTGPYTWFIGGGVVGASATTDLTVTKQRLRKQSWAYCTLEVYNIDDCAGDFPPQGSTVKFTKMSLTEKGGAQVTPSWSSLQNQNHCGSTLSVVSPDAVTITF